MRKYYIKIITGFREDQYEIIPMQEAHKAYHLFKNPDQRGVFSNGVAIVGRNIQEIKPAWNETMGWNATHQLMSDDWNEINDRGVQNKMRILIEKAKILGDLIPQNPNLLGIKMEEALKLLDNNQLLLR